MIDRNECTNKLKQKWINDKQNEVKFMISNIKWNGKCQNYVSVQRRVLEYHVKIKQYLRPDNKVNENKVLSYYEALGYMWKRN